MVQSVVWDWNGTLFADTQALMDAGNYVISSFGGIPVSRTNYAANFCFPVIDFLCSQGCDRDALLNSEWDKMFHEFYAKREAKCHTRKGAREVLHWLCEKSVDSVLLSVHFQESIEKQLLRLGLRGYFSEVIANTELEATKSGIDKVERMQDYFSRREYDPADALIITDSPEDVKTGKVIGMKTVAITDGYYSTPRLRASNPDYIIGTLKEVLELLRITNDMMVLAGICISDR